MKKAGLATTITLAVAFLTSNGTAAQSVDDQPSSKNRTEVTAKNMLTAPVVEHAETALQADMASRHANISVHIHHSKNDPISAERYAKGLANGFVDRERTRDRPIYITATHSQAVTERPTFVSVFVNGYQWDYKGDDELSPQTVAKLIPLIMDEYVQEHGTDKIIPDNQKPVLVTSFD